MLLLDHSLSDLIPFKQNIKRKKYCIFIKKKKLSQGPCFHWILRSFCQVQRFYTGRLKQLNDFFFLDDFKAHLSLVFKVVNFYGSYVISRYSESCLLLDMVSCVMQLREVHSGYGVHMCGVGKG